MRGTNEEGATPYCRCRVLYLGSSVPHASKEGLLGVQEPLRELYPEQGALGARGIDSWLSVWSNGLLLENVDEHRKKVTRFFPIEALHYCAAVRHVKGGTGGDSSTTAGGGGGGGGGATTRFLPLDSPFARTPSANHPPLFAAVLRRTTGIKVLECHAFICKRDMAANALVRCCFHAYADSSYAKGLDPSTITSGSGNGAAAAAAVAAAFTGAAAAAAAAAAPTNGGLYHTLGGGSSLDNNNESCPPLPPLESRSSDELASLCNGDENHKVWAKGRDELDTVYQEQGTLRSTRGSRPRQLVAPPPPPPPPPPPSSQSLLGDDSSATRRKAAASKKLKKAKNRSEHETTFHQQHHGMAAPQAIYTNGAHHTLSHPARQHPQQQQQQHYQQGPAPASGSRSLAGTLARPTPVLLVPAATLPRKAHHHHHHHHHHRHPPRGIVPAAAPIIPIYAPLPVVPPPPTALYQAGGYGTAGNRGRRSHQGILEPVDSSNLGASRRLTASHADLTATTDPDNHQRETESRFGTGIYRRKGHLNERAFSYSIRAEHRSRSHGSLASLGFSPAQNGGGGGGPPPAPIPKEEKKDREIAQLVAGLNLDEQERPRHPPGAYPRPNPHHHHHHHHHLQQPQPLPRPRPR